MEKLGIEVVGAWDEIEQILIDIQRLREKKQQDNFLDIHFDEQSLERFNEVVIQTYSSKSDTVKAIMCMLDQEVREEAPEIYMDVSWMTSDVLSQLIHSENLCEKPFVCHQLVNLRTTEESKDGLIENFQILHQVLPYAFAFHKEYDIRYTYTTRMPEGQIRYPWPHYIVTHKHVILCSEDKYHTLIITNEQAAQCYRRELEKIIRSYRPLFTYQGLSGEGIQKYRRMSENSEIHVIYEECPCIALMVPEKMQEQFKQDPEIGKYAQAYFEQNMTVASRFVNIFGMKEIKYFIQTGHLPGVFDEYFCVENVDERRGMIECFHQHLLAHTRRFYMVNEEKFTNCDGFGIELFGKSKIMFYSTSVEFPFGFITIDEPGICEVFLSYFEHLIDSEYLYSLEETIVQYEKMVEEYFEEGQLKGSAE